MPKTKRDLLKRRLGYALGCLEKAQEHAFELLTVFAEQAGVDLDADDLLDELHIAASTNNHGKLAQLLHFGIMQADASEKTFKAFAKHCWGRVPDKIERWTNTGQDYREEHPGD